MERPVGDPGPLGRREVQPDSAGLSHFYERGEAGTGRGGGHSERGVRGGATGGGGAARSWGGITTVPAHALLHGVRGKGVDRGRSQFPLFSLFCPFFCPLFCDFLGALLLSWDRPGQRAKGSWQRAATAQTADRKRTVHILAMI